MTQFFQAFRQHPATVGQTYLGHMAFALRFAGLLALAAVAALIHAVIPPLFETTASRLVKDMYQMLTKRHAVQDHVTSGSRI